MPVSDLKLITRQDLFEALVKNTGLLIIKFGAEWCTPCKKIEADVNFYMNNMPVTATCVLVDIDESFDLYSFLKYKKVVNGIPVILVYEKGNINYLPDQINIGSDKSQLHAFFQKCLQLCS